MFRSINPGGVNLRASTGGLKKWGGNQTGIPTIIQITKLNNNGGKNMGMLGMGGSLITGAIVLDTIPNITGSTAVTNIKSNTASGMEKVSSTFPTQGKIIGTTMVFKQLKKLKKIKY